MAENIVSRFKRAWNAFTNRDPTMSYRMDVGSGSYYRPDRNRLSRSNGKSVVSSIYNRIALDVASIDIKHVQLDDDDRYLTYTDSGLNECLTIEANIDQTARAFMQDLVMTMFDEGCVAIVPIDCTADPAMTESYDIYSMRVGRITQWYPQYVKVQVYNDQNGRKEERILPKRCVGIITNPFYAVMNEPNGTLQRLIRKMNLLDVVDEQSSSGKMDLIIQLPYTIKTEARQKDAERRRRDIERQLTDSKYGIAYIDGTEHITQLNRSVENNLLKQVEYLTNLLFSQLNITQSILDGTADEKTMLNYNSRTVSPIMTAIAEEIKRKFISKNARTRKYSIMFFHDPFKLVPISQIADIADKFTRNEIFTPNEIRQIVGVKPAGDPQADELRNRNISQSSEEIATQQQYQQPGEEEIQNGYE